MKSFDLVGGWFVWCSSDFVCVEQAADFVHDSTVHFFPLVTQDGQRSSELAEDLGQDSCNGFGFLGPEWKGLRPLGEGIKAGKYIDVSLVRPRVRSGEVYIPLLTRTTSQHRLQKSLSRRFSQMISSASSAPTTVVADVNSPLISEESSLYLVGGLPFAGVSSSAASMTLTDDFLHIGSWYHELEVIPLTSGGVSILSVDEVVVYLELIPLAD